MLSASESRIIKQLTGPWVDFGRRSNAKPPDLNPISAPHSKYRDAVSRSRQLHTITVAMNLTCLFTVTQTKEALFILNIYVYINRTTESIMVTCCMVNQVSRLIYEDIIVVIGKIVTLNQRHCPSNPFFPPLGH